MHTITTDFYVIYHRCSFYLVFYGHLRTNLHANLLVPGRKPTDLCLIGFALSFRFILFFLLDWISRWLKPQQVQSRALRRIFQDKDTTVQTHRDELLMS